MEEIKLVHAHYGEPQAWKDEDFTKPIIAVCNSFTQFVPGHVHLKDIGQLVAREIEKHGGVAKNLIPLQWMMG